MKKVLEGRAVYHCGSIIIDDSLLDLMLQDFSGKPVRITIEDLPESKPEPKNCGNCGNMRPDCTTHERRSCERWQPKAAEPHNTDVSISQKLTQIDTEPQGWEQRFEEITHLPKDCKNCRWDSESDSGHCSAEPVCQFSPEVDLNKIKAFLRAEIERVREEEQNKHREGGE